MSNISQNTYCGSIWSATAQIAEFSPLKGDLVTEAAVIGGGIAGLLIAYFLQQSGIKPVVLEAARIGSGQTKNTTAKITVQHGLIYRDLIKRLGRHKAALYAQANLRAIEDYKKIIQSGGIECCFEQVPSYLYSRDKGDVKLLLEEASAASSLGIDAEFTTKTSLPFEVSGAVKFNNQAQFHPLKFLSAISKGIKIYENTNVKSVEDGNLYIDSGGVVSAKYVIFATHYPFVNFPGLYFTKMYQERSYAVALENAAKLDGTYLEIGKEGFSMRNIGDLLILGGGDHRTGDNTSGGKYDLLASAAQDFWQGCTEKARWSAQDCITIDGVPYIGAFSAAKPYWYVATGFAKWGMTTSMVAASIITDLITGKENPATEVFCPERKPPAYSVKRFLGNIENATKGLCKTFLTLPLKNADSLRPGCGGVIMSGGKKMGAYRDEEGRLYTIDIKCPHLGCQLKWNADERSWDCPCHGSRFTYTGKLIDNPAQQDIEPQDV